MRDLPCTIAAFAVLSAAVACGGDHSTPTAERTDSAGIEIVTAVAPHWGDGEGWRLDSIPRWTPSGTGSEYEFTQVTDATVLNDGRVVVLNAGTRQVRLFAPDGQFLGQIGREGEGPGDFQRLATVSAFRTDSILVFDFWLRRATILGPSGLLARIVTLPPEFQVEELYPVTHDLLVGKTWSLEEFYEQEGPYRGEYRLLGFGAEGEVLDSIGALQGWNGYKVNREDGGYSDISPLFILDGHVSANDHGIVTSSGDAPEISRYSPDGVLEQVVRAPSISEPLSEEEIQGERAWLDRPQAPSWLRQAVRDMPVPEKRPAHGDLLLDSEGFTWAARYWSPRLNPDDPVRWDIFDPSGEWIGTLDTPERFEVLEVGNDYVLGVRRDDLDVEQVQILALDRQTQN